MDGLAFGRRRQAKQWPRRWWSKWEVMAQVFKYFGDIEPFLTQNADFSQSTRAKFWQIFSDPNKNIILQIGHVARREATQMCACMRRW